MRRRSLVEGRTVHANIYCCRTLYSERLDGGWAWVSAEMRWQMSHARSSRLPGSVRLQCTSFGFVPTKYPGSPIDVFDPLTAPPEVDVHASYMC